MAELKISDVKQRLMETFKKYEELKVFCDDNLNDLVHDMVKEESEAPFESYNLLLQVLLEMVCKNVEQDEQRRHILFLKMWHKLTEAKLTNEMTFRMDALFPVRNKIVAQFEKELLQECSKINSSEDQSSIVNQCSSLSINPAQNPTFLKDSSICMEKYLLEFEEITRIGKGGFGTVWKAKHKIDDVCYAVKKIGFKYNKDSDYLKIIREVKSIASLSHSNVVGYNQAWLEYLQSSDQSESDEDSETNSSYTKSTSETYSSNTKFTSETNSCNTKFTSETNSSYIQFISDEESLSKNTIKTFESSKSTSDESKLSINSKSSSTEDSDVIFNATYDMLTKPPILRVMLYIQMEYCDCDLKFWMDANVKGDYLPFQLSTLEIFKDILSGVAHIHSKNIIHRDLKPQNIFYSSKSNAMKIGDFGLATLVDEINEKSPTGQTLNCGTLPYAAPEQRTSSKYDSKVDMYSVGVIFIELLLKAETKMELIAVLRDFSSGIVPEDLSHNMPEYVELLKNLISSDPAIRFSAEQVLSHFSLQDNPQAEMKRLKEMLNEKDKRIEELEELLKHYQTSSSTDV